jgi:uncharacterized protein (DUF2249 family)
MILTPETKISEILKEKPEALEAIISLNKHFKKLKNPVLRKVLAPRVNVRQAAEIGNTQVYDFLKKMEEIGFNVLYGDLGQEAGASVDNNNFPDTYTLDVRPVIESGADPFKDIMLELNRLNEGEGLLLVNSFNPIPLTGLLREKGYTVFSERKADDLYHTHILKTNSVTSSRNSKDATTETYEDDWNSKLISYGSNLVEIDVRNLEMPEPMVRILEELGRLPDTHILLVHHKKIPQFLLPELKSRDYRWMSSPVEGGVDLLIYKD